jgi:hypothetical protein
MNEQNDKCQCKLCLNIDKYRWATVMECKCVCHDSDGLSGHESLCCEYPNVLKRNNPYMDLLSSNCYNKIINDSLEK